MPSTEGLRAGDDLGAAAQIVLHDQHGNERRLSEFRGHGLVIYFYPADDTPGCTVEGREFRDLDEAFSALKCAVVGVIAAFTMGDGHANDTEDRRCRCLDRHCIFDRRDPLSARCPLGNDCVRTPHCPDYPRRRFIP